MARARLLAITHNAFLTENVVRAARGGPDSVKQGVQIDSTSARHVTLIVNSGSSHPTAMLYTIRAVGGVHNKPPRAVHNNHQGCSQLMIQPSDRLARRLHPICLIYHDIIGTGYCYCIGLLQTSYCISIYWAYRLLDVINSSPYQSTLMGFVEKTRLNY